MHSYIKKYIGFLLILLLLFLGACPGPEYYPNEPEVNFKKVVLTDSFDALGNKVKRLTLVFNVVDGNGDIGLREQDTISPFVGEYRYNCYTTLYEKIDGELVPAELSAPYNFRIPYVEPQGQNKLLKADIYLDMDFTVYGNGELLYDSIAFDFFIYDRSLNQSNIDKTPVIYLDTTGYFIDSY